MVIKIYNVAVKLLVKQPTDFGVCVLVRECQRRRRCLVQEGTAHDAPLALLVLVNHNRTLVLCLLQSRVVNDPRYGVRARRLTDLVSDLGGGRREGMVR